MSSSAYQTRSELSPPPWSTAAKPITEVQSRMKGDASVVQLHRRLRPYTEPSTPAVDLGATASPPITRSTSVISEVDGIILGHSETLVRVKLGSATVVEFPSELFFGLTIERGMPISYQIKVRPDGTRYQSFVEGVPSGSKETMEQLNELLRALSE